jgi:NAD(P)-dependent dehydrogenase (short-subunit alcohol dehydrogenase family)
MDPVAARRTQAGAAVVHGAHTLLWALQCLVESGIMVSALVQIKVKFLKWLYVGEESTLILPAGERSDPRLVQVEAAGVCVLSAELSYGQWTPINAIGNLTPSPSTPRAIAIERSFGELISCAGSAYTATARDAAAVFPQLSRYLTGTTVAEIAACSYIVGMEVPGLHSMFSKLDLAISGNFNAVSSTTGLGYRVSAHDERFRKVRIEVAGRGVRGTLEVFVRQPPVEQASMGSVSTMVGAREFFGMQPLIVGGSRGLGELTAKLVAAGGGSPTITYAVGKADAERIADEILAWGGTVDVLQYDVRHAPAPQLVSLKSHVTHLFYFATNPIFRPKKNLVSHPILTDFVTYYLQGFHDLCLQLLKQTEAHSPNGRNLYAYYPSSVAIEERPAGMTEYSMVKAAGEQMCRDMNQYLSGLRILTSRLPRLRTDQTASVLPERDVDAISVLLPIIRQMNSMPNED